MASSLRIEIGDTVAAEQRLLSDLLSALQAQGYRLVGPRLQRETLIYGPINGVEDLPVGYISEQAAGRFRLVYAGNGHYFDVIPGAQSWKQFLFPPRLKLFDLQRNGNGWQFTQEKPEAPAYAFIGVRACELAAMQVQDRIFIRDDFVEPEYRSRRERAFVLAVNCLHPAGNCFCGSMGTGPRVGVGYDLSLTELDDAFLITIGSELGRGLIAGMQVSAASAFLLGLAAGKLQQAEQATREGPGTTDLRTMIESQLDGGHWEEVARRCLGCGNCTAVCPTCFCWDAVDQTDLTGTRTSRERVWDSCFNPSYTHTAGGNIRPSIRSRYRQWLSHKFGTWLAQHGTAGCVGCGRCITWCPAEIDVRQELAALEKEAAR